MGTTLNRCADTVRISERLQISNARFPGPNDVGQEPPVSMALLGEPLRSVRVDATAGSNAYAGRSPGKASTFGGGAQMRTRLSRMEAFVGAVHRCATGAPARQHSAHIRQRRDGFPWRPDSMSHRPAGGCHAVFGPTRQYFDGLILFKAGSDDGLANQSRSTSDEWISYAGQTTRGGFLLYLQTTSEHLCAFLSCFNASPHSNGLAFSLFSAFTLQTVYNAL